MTPFVKLACPLAIVSVFVVNCGPALGQPIVARHQNNAARSAQPIQGQGADWLAPVFGTQSRYRGVARSNIQQLNELGRFQRNMMNEFGGLNLTQPNGVGRQRASGLSSVNTTGVRPSGRYRPPGR